MSKYNKLTAHLQSIDGDAWQASFAALEAIVGFPLPKSAYQYPAWWSNQTGDGHSQTSAWQGTGWRTSDLDLGAQKVTFRRKNSVKEAPQTVAPKAEMVERHGLTIVEAKAGLATYFGVTPESVEITIKG